MNNSTAPPPSTPAAPTTATPETPIRGPHTTPPSTRTKNLKNPVARLIWAITTLVPAGEPGRFTGDDAKYNAVAAQVMKRHGIPINDLHALSASFPAEMFVGPGDVHFTGDGAAKLADQVAETISATLSGIDRGSGNQ